MKKRRIAFYHNLPPGGAKRVIYEEIKYLTEKNYIEVYQIYSQHNDFLNITDLKCKVNNYIFPINNNPKGPIARIIRDINLFINLKKINKKIARDIDKNDFDFVIVHPDKYIQAPFVLRYLKTPSAYYCHEWLRLVYEKQFDIRASLSLLNSVYETFFRFLLKIEERKNVRNATKILSNSINTQKNVLNAYSKKSFVCYPGVDTDIFKPVNLNREFCLFIGDKIPANGFNLITDSCIADSNFSKKLKLLNTREKISDKELVRLYNKSFATLCLSRNEPFGLTAIESMACGTPVIAVNEGGFKESVIPNKTGFLINRNVHELKDKISLLEKNKKIGEKIGRNGRIHVIKNFPWEKHIKILTNVIRANSF